MTERIELGCTGHLIVGDSCRWKRHTRVGSYRISSVGNYYPSDRKERETVGCDRYFETMVFKLQPDAEDETAEGCGCGVVADWGEIDVDSYNTAGEAQAGHERMVEKYMADRLLNFLICLLLILSCEMCGNVRCVL